MKERKRQFNLSLSDDEYEKLKSVAKDTDMSKYIRKCIFDNETEIMFYKSILEVCTINLKAIREMVNDKEIVDKLIKFLEDKK